MQLHAGAYSCMLVYTGACWCIQLHAGVHKCAQGWHKKCIPLHFGAYLAEPQRIQPPAFVGRVGVSLDREPALFMHNSTGEQRIAPIVLASVRIRNLLASGYSDDNANTDNLTQDNFTKKTHAHTHNTKKTRH
jgi:hypothetical protein